MRRAGNQGLALPGPVGTIRATVVRGEEGWRRRMPRPGPAYTVPVETSDPLAQLSMFCRCPSEHRRTRCGIARTVASGMRRNSGSLMAERSMGGVNISMMDAVKFHPWRSGRSTER